MLLLTCLISTWLEHVHTSNCNGTAHSYADDISLWAKSRRKLDLCNTIRNMHDLTAKFITRCGMTMNLSKCFTFGHKCVLDIIPAIQSHKAQFRLVGGSIKLDNKSSWTKLEEERVTNWKSTVGNIRALPTGWFTKVNILKASSSQLTWGQGTHKLNFSSQTLRGLRACVIRTLLNESFYDCSPGIIFSILAPPSLDPEFSLHLSAFLLIKRVFTDSASRAKLCATLHSPPVSNETDGPIARMRQLYNHPVFKNTMHKFLNNQIHEQCWQHNLREDFRQHTWKTIARDRPQHFAGISHGVNRSLTNSLIHLWTKEAEKLQHACDTQQLIMPDPSIDPRPRLKILRMLISGGLQTPERDHRHRRKTGHITCACKNGSPTLLHISWCCPLYQTERKPALDHLPDILDNLPHCFKIATIVPKEFVISKHDLHIIQDSLVTVWQKHIQPWNEDKHSDFVTRSNTLSNQPDITLQPAAKKGHVLKNIPDGSGVFCCKCGRQVKRTEHIRLKILRKPCTYPDLPEAEWLSEPGAINSVLRLRDAEDHMNNVHNTGNHQLTWNRQAGKVSSQANYGLIWCSRCDRTFAWKNRRKNLKTVCQPKVPIPAPPQWVQNLPHFRPSSSVNPEPKVRPLIRHRIHGKQSSFERQQSNSGVFHSFHPHNESGEAASSSTDFPRRGIG